MLSGWNAFEISAIQDIQLSRPKTGDQDVTMLHRVENRWMEFLRSTVSSAMRGQITGRHILLAMDVTCSHDYVSITPCGF